MKEFPPSDEYHTLISYNKELWYSFLGGCAQLIDEVQDPNQQNEFQQCLDLLRAINSYRSYSSPTLLFQHHPELQEQEEYVTLLWQYFSGLSNEQLSDLAIEMILELNKI